MLDKGIIPKALKFTMAAWGATVLYFKLGFMSLTFFLALFSMLYLFPSLQ